MTTSELDGTVNKIKPEVVLRPENSRTKQFGSYKELKEFFTNENAFWSKFSVAPINEIKGSFNQIVTALQLAEQQPNLADGKIREVVQLARNAPILYSGTAAGALIARIGAENQESAAGNTARAPQSTYMAQDDHS